MDELAANLISGLKSQQPNQLLYRLVSYLAKQVSMEQAIDFISNIEDYKNEGQVRDIYNAYKAIERFALLDQQRTRLNALAQNTVNFSDEALKYIASINQTALAQVVSIYPSNELFNDIDATISDKEIKDFFKKNKSRYTIKTDSRDIDVAVFPIQPSPEDLAAIRDTAMSRAERLKAAASIEDYNISMMHGQLDSIYFKRSDIQIDTLAKLIFDRPVGSFIEPFEYENVVWYYGKTYGMAKRPDSVHVAYLVVDFKTDRNPNGTRTKEEAKNIADSLKKELQRGADIFKLMPDFLAGRKAEDTTAWFSEHGVYRQLYDSLLTKTIFVHDVPAAYVVYKILERSAPVEKRLFVIYTEEIKPSDATIKAIRSEATQLQVGCNSAEELMTAAAQKGIQVTQGKDISSMAASISQLQNVREIVSWAFSPNTALNAVSDVYNINNSGYFAVAAVREIKKKGDPKLEQVRETIETELKATKKLALIQDKINTQIREGVSLQQIAEKYQVGFMDSVRLTFGGETYQNRSIEHAALGKIFALEANTPWAVTGKSNLYAVSVYEINEAGEPSPNFMMEKSALRNAVAGRSRNESTIMEGLKEKAAILDQRYLFFAR